MASTFTCLTYHVVFSTKYRRRTINADWQDDLYRYISGIAHNHDGQLLEIGGVDDHVHLLLGIGAKIAVADMIRVIKANSSKWVNEEFPLQTPFQWQTGYSAFTVSYSQDNVVRNYIRNQAEHHRKLSFQDELLALLRRHEIPYDPRYVFEEEHHA